MKTYEITIEKVEHRVWTYEVQATHQDQAEELAWARKIKESEPGQLVAKDEYIDHISIKEYK